MLKLARILLISGGLISAAITPAAAEQFSVPTQGAWSVQYGAHSDIHRFTLNYETQPLWSYPVGRTRLHLVGELGVSYWRYDRHPVDSHRNAWQLSAIPMFQWWLTPQLYLEAGIGATVFNTTSFADKQLSTAFQFGDHIGVGFQVTDAMRINVRLSHFSNAGIKRPNPGLNSVQVGVTVRW